jgi:hypothetical protein
MILYGQSNNLQFAWSYKHKQIDHGPDIEPLPLGILGDTHYVIP